MLLPHSAPQNQLFIITLKDQKSTKLKIGMSIYPINPTLCPPTPPLCLLIDEENSVRTNMHEQWNTSTITSRETTIGGPRIISLGRIDVDPKSARILEWYGPKPETLNPLNFIVETFIVPIGNKVTRIASLFNFIVLTGKKFMREVSGCRFQSQHRILCNLWRRCLCVGASQEFKIFLVKNLIILVGNTSYSTYVSLQPGPSMFRTNFISNFGW